MDSIALHQQVLDATERARASMTLQNVPINVYESSAAMVVVAPFPTVQPDDVVIELADGKLRIFGELRSAGPRPYLIQEWKYGGYEREIDVPAGFGAGLEASLSQGQLAVRVLRGEPSTAPLRIQPADTALALD